MNFNEPYYIAKAILHDLGVSKDTPILDVGCGTGKMAVLLNGLGFSSIIGIDRSATMLMAAEAKGIYESLHLH